MKKFKIGQRVKVNAVTFFEYDSDKNRIPRRAKTNICGVIVGAKYRFLGKYKDGSTSQSSLFPLEPSYGPFYLDVRGSVLLWEVKCGYLNKPLESQEKDIELFEFDDIPWKKHNIGIHYPINNRWEHYEIMSKI